MAAQRRSLLQSVRNRAAPRAGGWEPEGALSGAGAAPFGLARGGRRPPLSRAGPPSPPRPGSACSRARPARARCRRPSGAGTRGAATPSVEGAWRAGSAVRAAAWCRAGRLTSRVSCQLLYVVSLIYVTAPGGSRLTGEETEAQRRSPLPKAAQPVSGSDPSGSGFWSRLGRTMPQFPSLSLRLLPPPSGPSRVCSRCVLLRCPGMHTHLGARRLHCPARGGAASLDPPQVGAGCCACLWTGAYEEFQQHLSQGARHSVNNCRKAFAAMSSAWPWPHRGAADIGPPALEGLN